jgi:hypothetical protein
MALGVLTLQELEKDGQRLKRIDNSKQRGKRADKQDQNVAHDIPFITQGPSPRQATVVRVPSCYQV